MREDDFFSTGSGAAGGALTGASIGSLFPGAGTAIGAGAGALIGGGLGFLSGRRARKAKQAQQRNIQQAREEMLRMYQQQRAQRMADMDRALSYYGPVDDVYARLFGDGSPGSGGGSQMMPPSPMQQRQLPSLPGMDVESLLTPRKPIKGGR